MKSAYKLMTEKSKRKSLRGIEEQSRQEALELEEIAVQTWEDEGGSVELACEVESRAEA
jgi:hypothetical protein